MVCWLENVRFWKLVADHPNMLLLGVILLFTVICLAMAAHFQAVLAASDLSTFLAFPPRKQ